MVSLCARNFFNMKTYVCEGVFVVQAEGPVSYKTPRAHPQKNTRVDNAVMRKMPDDRS